MGKSEPRIATLTVSESWNVARGRRLAGVVAAVLADLGDLLSQFTIKALAGDTDDAVADD
jgi:hypothetical protein